MVNRTPVQRKSEICFKRVLPTDDRMFLITHEMILLLELIDESKTIAQIVKEANLSPQIFRSTLKKLMKEGLIEPFEVKCVYLNKKDFLNPLRKSMRDAVGPVADFYIEEVVSGMGYEMDSIPAEKASQLISQLSNAIKDSERKSVFCQTMFSLVPD